MFKTPFRVAWSGALLVGVPVWTATKVDPSQTMTAIMYGGVAWLGLNMVMYIREVLDTPVVSAYDEDDLANAFTDGYLNAREDVGLLARHREEVIRKYYEDKLSSVGNETKKIVNITNNDYSTTNNIKAVPQIEDNIVDTKLIGE